MDDIQRILDTKKNTKGVSHLPAHIYQELIELFLSLNPEC